MKKDSPHTESRSHFTCLFVLLTSLALVMNGCAAISQKPAEAALARMPLPTALFTYAPRAGLTQNVTAAQLLKGPEVIYTGKSSEMKLFWQTSTSKTLSVDWGADAASTSSSAPAVEYDPVNHLYSVVLTGLAPNTRYYYWLAERGAQTQTTPKIDSTRAPIPAAVTFRVHLPAVLSGKAQTAPPVGSFRTAPDGAAAELKFVSYGDTRTHPDVHNAVAAQVMALVLSDPGYQTFNLVPGDLVTRGDQDSLWGGEMFNRAYPSIQSELASLAFISARGNHEDSAALFARYFPMPYVGKYYWSFDYGPVHVAVIDQYSGISAGSAQYAWLKKDLEASTRTWKVVVLHAPGWSAGGGHANDTTVQNVLQPLFVKTGISLVIGGHNHYYARAVVEGVTHLTIGTGGAETYTPDTHSANIVATWQGNGFCTFEIQGNTLTGTFLDSQGTARDTFTIQK